MQRKNLTIDASLSGRTVRSLLERELLFSRRRITRIKQRDGALLLNGVPVFVTASVREGDVLSVETADDPLRVRIRPRADGVQIPVLYEDAELIVINKPAGLAVHASGRGEDEPTVESVLAAMMADGVPHPVSRLDRGTTGVMVLAKSGYIHDRLRRMQHTDAFSKEYRGIAEGIVTPCSGVIDRPIGFAEGSSYQRAVRDDGQRAVTRYETLLTGNGRTLLRLVPVTGRTHQLRVHMASLGYPLTGDFLYGTEDPALIARPALHAWRVELRHPITGALLALCAPVPEDMERLLR